MDCLVGTMGYMAPEWALNLPITAKKIIDRNDSWIEDVIDPRLCGQFSRNQAAKMVELGFVCAEEEKIFKLLPHAATYHNRSLRLSTTFSSSMSTSQKHTLYRSSPPTICPEKYVDVQSSGLSHKRLDYLIHFNPTTVTELRRHSDFRDLF
ncbi:hypothetical protein GIB67_007759 [Kingdonia uniflora]|uniref:Protein kinase domain-containing protein n=1 Tax=Kingdonia uniflora TaxID=39325 RepID=A0A7J7N2H4_9MAGN|nr:hypothetical protein GIB67_007759 [Kingdonia uniflora]